MPMTTPVLQAEIEKRKRMYNELIEVAERYGVTGLAIVAVGPEGFFLGAVGSSIEHSIWPARFIDSIHTLLQRDVICSRFGTLHEVPGECTPPDDGHETGPDFVETAPARRADTEFVAEVSPATAHAGDKSKVH